jgi:hypothetical protein
MFAFLPRKSIPQKTQRRQEICGRRSEGDAPAGLQQPIASGRCGTISNVSCWTLATWGHEKHLRRVLQERAALSKQFNTSSLTSRECRFYILAARPAVFCSVLEGGDDR